MNALRNVYGISVLFLLCLGCSLLSAQSQDTAAYQSDAEAVALYEGMIRAFRNATSLSFRSTYSFAVDGREMGRCTYRISMKKPGYVRMEAFHQKGTTPAGVLVGNEDGFWIYWPMGRPRQGDEDSTGWVRSREKVYMHRSIPARRYSIAHESSLLGSCIVMPAVQLSMFHGSPDGMAAEKEGVRLVGREEAGGVACSVIEVSYLNHQRSKFYWLSDRDSLPRKAKDVVRTSRELSATEFWTEFRLNEPIPNDLFAWRPPEDWAQWFSASDEAALLPPGTAAPDFACTTLQHGTFRLSAHRGKPILLNFWRLGCPPCQREAVALEQIHREFAGKGLVVVGFNCSDDSARIAAFLRNRGVTYTHILDTSAAAVEVYARRYRTNAVPATYLIGEDGSIIDRWVGFDRRHLMRAVERLKLH